MMVPLAREPVQPHEVKIHVVIPFYNCYDSGFLGRCIDSVLEQTHQNVNVVMIDDASTDMGWWKAGGVSQSHGWTFIQNDKNLRCPYNLWNGIKRSNAAPRDVIYLLDGDDYLPHEGVLTRFAEIYAEADTWMTYGQYMSDPPDYQCCPAQMPSPETIYYRNYRQVPSFFNHPITFRKFLWDAIPVEQFKDSDGNWFRAGYDRAIIYPLLELATGLSESDEDWPLQQELHWRFLNEVSYVYNSINPVSEWRLRLPEADTVNQVHTRPPLNPLNVRSYVP